MGWRCELCDSFLPILQFSNLCPTCYKIRTIIKCYTSTHILDSLESVFVVDYELKKPLTLPPTIKEESGESEVEHSTKEPTIDMNKFKEELEERVVGKFMVKDNVITRSNKHFKKN